MASPNEFKILISAEDKTTGTINKVLLNFGKINKPIQMIGNGIKTIDRENHLTNLLNGFTSLSRQTSDVARAIESVVPPMTELLSAATIGGIAALAYQFANVARQIELVSRYTGVSKNNLQEWAGAGELAGIPGGSMLSSLSEYQKRIENAVYRRDPALLAATQAYQIDIGNPMSGARNVDEVLRQVMEKLRGGKIGQAQLDALGLQQLSPLLTEGTEALDESIKKLHEYGYIQGDEAIRAGNKFQQNLFETKIAIEGLGKTIGSELIPVLEPVIIDLNNFLKDHHVQIAKDLTMSMKFLGEELKVLVTPIYDIGKAFGLWADKAQALSVAITAISGAGLLKILSKIPGGTTMLAGSGYYQLYKHSYFPEIFGEAWDEYGDWRTKFEKEHPLKPLPQFYQEPFNYPPMPDAAQTPITTGGSATGLKFENGKVQLDVNFHNAPPGMRSIMQSNGNVDSSQNIHYSLMPNVMP